MLFNLLAITLSIILCCYWFRALYIDFMHENYWWALFDLLPLFGVLRGIYLDFASVGEM